MTVCKADHRCSVELRSAQLTEEYTRERFRRRPRHMSLTEEIGWCPEVTVHVAADVLLCGYAHVKFGH